jgi:cytochrome oxidase Cu insertion factor (SCO1/SenC/PrrC family)
MIRWLVTFVIAALLVLDLVLEQTPMGRRGDEASTRNEVSGAVGTPGELLPELALLDLDGRPLVLSDMRGHPTIITFERSVDW